MTNNTGIIPLGLNVLIEMPKKVEKTKAGIIIPTDNGEAHQITQKVAKIIECGEDAFTNAFGNPYYRKSAIIGKYAVINMHAGLEIDVRDCKYRLISSDEIRAIIDVGVYESLNKIGKVNY
jgi:co-chaperonin GroES (HSP10)